MKCIAPLMRRRSLLPIFSLVLLASSAGAQIPVGEATTTYCHRIARRAITQVPPITRDMNERARLGYIYFDSVMRAPVTDSWFKSFESMQSLDSLKSFVRVLYEVTDYDPALFKEYCSVGQHLAPAYWGRPATIYGAVHKKAFQTLGYTSIENYLLNASYVVRVKVTDVFSDSDVDAGARFVMPGRAAMPLRCFAAKVLKRYKGQVMLDRGSVHSLTDSSDYLHAYYSPVWTKDVFTANSFGVVRQWGGSLPANSYGYDALERDSEYLLFLTCDYLDYDGTKAYFSVSFMPGYDSTGGVFPIHSGILDDRFHYFSSDDSISVQQVEAILADRIAWLRK
jgi:hypothetical protein